MRESLSAIEMNAIASAVPDARHYQKPGLLVEFPPQKRTIFKETRFLGVRDYYTQIPDFFFKKSGI